MNINVPAAITTVMLMIPGHIAFPQNWQIDYAHSAVQFEINHYFTPVPGRFQRFTANLAFDALNPSDGMVSFVIDVSTINTNQVKRDRDLVSNQFFDASRYPKIIFISRRIEKISPTEFVAIGTLTIRNISREITIPFSLLGLGDHPSREGRELLGIQSQFVLDRNDFDLGKGRWQTSLVLGNEVTCRVTIEAFRQKRSD
jgi:polyisoprenoid-binding protein YceI